MHGAFIFLTSRDMHIFAKNSDLMMDIYKSLDKSLLDLTVEVARLTEENEDLQKRVALLEHSVYNKK